MRKGVVVSLALCSLMADVAHAQVQSGTGFFGFVDGAYFFAGGSGPRLSSIPGLTAQAKPGDGWGVDGKLGWAFGGGWDVAIGGAYHGYGRGKSAGNSFASTFRVTDSKVWNLDGEVGYTISGPGYGVRPALGVRVLRVVQKSSDDVLLVFPGGPVSNRNATWAFGPHVGVDAAMNLFGPVSLFGGLETALLWGKVRNSFSSQFLNVGSKDSRMMWQIGGRLGLDWEIVPLVHIAAGYRVNYSEGLTIATATLDAADGAVGRGSVLEHGPFVRLTFNWGAPAPGVPSSPPVSSGTRSFMVFFDFDRANLTPTAVQTIKQAAEQAKAGRATRIDVTGHADRAGADAYNMALSLRRAIAVKDQLVREGLGASQIAVVGRGESQPLVPTADGVREPQNRRVEIVIN